MEVRDVRPEEVDAVGALTATVYRAEGFGSEAYEPHLRDAASRAATASVLVAVDGDDLLGAVTLVLGPGPWANVAAPGEAEIRMLVVDPAHRGRGVGEALSRAAVDRARRAGSAIVRLSSETEMHAAHRLYERLGFVRAPSFDWVPEPGKELLGYALPLVPWCGQCGEELTAEGHERCRRAAELEPPRYCAHCRRRMVVQVVPTGWSARCVEHGTRTA